MAATKIKKKPAAKKAPPKTAVPENPFAPGTKVGVWPPAEAEFVRTDEREPPSKPITTATVGKDGELEFTGLKPGSYIASGQVAESGGRFGARFLQVAFVAR